MNLFKLYVNITGGAMRLMQVLPPTFLIVTSKRYISTILYTGSDPLRNPDYISGRLLPRFSRTVSFMLARAFRASPFLHHMYISVFPEAKLGFMTARTRFFDNAVRSATQNGTKQIVVLAAGLDSRAYRMRDDLKDVKVFELDLPETQQYKIKMLRQECLYSDWQATFLPADFSNSSWVNDLECAGCDLDEPTCIIWEGCTYYLDTEKVQKTLKNLRRPGVTLHFDFINDYILRKDAGGDIAGQRITAAVRYLNEPWVFGLPKNGLHEWVRSQGWATVDVCEGAAAMSQRYFPNVDQKDSAFDFWGLATVRPM